MAKPAPITLWGAGIRLFYEPGQVFAQLASRRHTWFPLLLLMLSSGIIAYGYFSVVDLDWLHEESIASIDDPAVRELASSTKLSGSVARNVSAVAAAIAIPIVSALFGVYFLFVSITQKYIGFRAGFSLAAWSSLPLLLQFPLAVAQWLLASGDQFTFESLNPLTLNQLFFQLDQAHPMAGILESLSVPFVWSMVLMVIGYEAWAKVSRVNAITVVLIPYGLIYGAKLALALSQAA